MEKWLTVYSIVWHVAKPSLPQRSVRGRVREQAVSLPIGPTSLYQHLRRQLGVRQTSVQPRLLACSNGSCARDGGRPSYRSAGDEHWTGAQHSCESSADSPAESPEPESEPEPEPESFRHFFLRELLLCRIGEY